MTVNLYSASRTLVTQSGNSLEMSNVLVSLLVGFGFEAFVVCGNVERKVAEMDRSQEYCNLLRKEEKEAQEKAKNVKRKYSVENPPTLKSEYLQFDEEHQQQQQQNGNNNDNSEETEVKNEETTENEEEN